MEVRPRALSRWPVPRTPRGAEVVGAARRRPLGATCRGLGQRHSAMAMAPDYRPPTRAPPPLRPGVLHRGNSPETEED